MSKKTVVILALLITAMPVIAANSKSQKLINTNTTRLKIICQPYPECVEYGNKVRINFFTPKVSTKNKQQSRKNSKYSIMRSEK